MGTWGPGIFDQDVATDVRHAFRELVAHGRTAEEATAWIAQRFELDARLWLALGIAQWQTGRLLDDVRDRAVEAVGSELGALAAWPEELRRRRATALEKARDALLGPQRKPRRLRPEPRPQSPYRPGDVLAFTASSGREVALWAMDNTMQETVVGVSVDTSWQLAAIGNPALPALEEIVQGEPPVLTAPNGWRSCPQLRLEQPQDATGPAWRLLGNVPFPPERRRSYMAIYAVQSSGPDDPGAIDGTVELWAAAAAVRDPLAQATQHLLDAAPGWEQAPTSWDGFPKVKAAEIGARLGQALSTGSPDGVAEVLAALEALATGDADKREIAAATTSALRQNLALDATTSLLGPATRELLDAR